MLGNDRTFSLPGNGFDIPIDLVDDGIEAIGNRRGAVRAFRCHGTSVKFEAFKDDGPLSCDRAIYANSAEQITIVAL